MHNQQFGFIDIQLNGHLGIDFSSPGITIEGVHVVTNKLLNRGTIAYCPTVVTAPFEVIEHSLSILSKAMNDKDFGKNLLGIHLEGPFISPQDGPRGAHRKEFIRLPSIEDFDRFQELANGNIVLLTVAPELPGSIDLIRHAVKNSVVVALGHHNANYDQITQAVEAGATCVTHLGNGISSSLNRNDNPIWWQMACDNLYASFVTDGHHISKSFIKTALRTKTIDKFIVISDASQFSGMPPGRHYVWNQTLIIDESLKMYFEGSEYLAGSNATMIDCMNFIASLELLNEDELWKIGFSNPLKLLGKNISVSDGMNLPILSFKGNHFKIIQEK